MIRYYGYKTVDGTKIYYYACASYKRYGNAVCSKHAVRYDILEEIVLNELNECNKTIHEYKDFINKNRAKIKNNVNSLQNEIKKSKNELDRISNLKQGLYEDYKERIISKDEYVNFKNDYINKEDIINKNLILLQERLNESQDDKLSSWLEKFAEFGIIENLDRNIMATFVNCIYVLDDNNNLFIDYKFNDDLKHILKDKTIYDISYNN
jgi:ribosome-binding protein aMBF1 (putative translation factor)